MAPRNLIGLTVLMGFLISCCAIIPTTDFNKMFSMPREPRTALAPGQYRELQIPEGKKVIITDIYVKNLGGGTSVLVISEQTGPNTFEVRYTFPTGPNELTIVNYTTGLRLGDLRPIEGRIRIDNDYGSQASILPRVNGIIIK